MHAVIASCGDAFSFKFECIFTIPIENTMNSSNKSLIVVTFQRDCLQISNFTSGHSKFGYGFATKLGNFFTKNGVILVIHLMVFRP